MNKFGEKYVVDTNFLISHWMKIKDSPRVDAIVILDCVANECKTDDSEWRHLVCETVADTYAEVQRVFDVAKNAGIHLVDLYNEQGASDPVLLAYVLAENRGNQGALFSSKYVIVTDDKAVQRVAEVLGVDCYLSSKFLSEVFRIVV